MKSFNQISFLLLVSAFLLFSLSCKQKQASIENVKTNCEINPNGESELALLMRKMYLHLKSERDSTLVGKHATTYPTEFEKMYTATPTDEHTKDEMFDPMAEVFLKNLEVYHNVSDSLPAYYNVLVSGCENCHLHYCPGPLEKIRKLYIK